MTTFLASPSETIWRAPTRLGDADERRILLADDDIQSCHAMTLALGDAGFSTRMAHTGLDAVTVAGRWRPRAVVLDLSMPLGDGWEVAAAIRSADPETFLVAHTSFTSHAEWVRSKRAGIDAYFVKPCNLAHLFGLLAKCFPI